jgi:hypothetical protein
MMYPWHPDPNAHAALFHHALLAAIDGAKAGDEAMRTRLQAQKEYADTYYSWDVRAWQWEHFLRGLVHLPR